MMSEYRMSTKEKAKTTARKRNNRDVHLADFSADS